jgi:hypothetical protein
MRTKVDESLKLIIKATHFRAYFGKNRLDWLVFTSRKLPSAYNSCNATGIVCPQNLDVKTD